ncbi:MAG: hypothetical protein M3R00_04705, partial [Pseudomonadota bacterium]|nr:hypothetical protein [Pseudomonadota bacterium]
MHNKTIHDLLSAAPLLRHNNHGFAMLHDASAIRNSPWEGMLAIEACRYMGELLHLESFPLSLGITAAQLKVARDANDDLMAFFALFDSFVGADGLNINIPAIVSLIQERITAKQGVCYLPSGWCNDEKEAHFSVVKARHLKGALFACSILDRGVGIGFHAPLAQGKIGKKVKRDYQFKEYVIDVSSVSGQFFLQAIVSLQLDRRPFSTEEKIVGKTQAYNKSLVDAKLPNHKKTIRPYNQSDLYGYLIASGEPLGAEEYDPRHAVTPQRTGTCAMSNSKLASSDALITVTNASITDIKRFSFGIKLAALVEAHKAYLVGKCDRKLLAWALRESDVRVGKHYLDSLNAEEMQFCSALLGAIQSSYEQIQNTAIQKACTLTSLPSLTGSYTLSEKSSSYIPVKQPDEASHNESKVEGPIVDFAIIEPSPNDIVDYIRSAREHFKVHSRIENQLQLHQFMRSLPTTTGHPQDPFWDQLPDLAVASVIADLSSLVDSLDGYAKLPKRSPLELALIAYDICAQLAPRVPELKLRNYYALALSDVISTVKFSDAEIYYSVKQIALNFQRRLANRKPVLSNNVEAASEDQTYYLLTNEIVTVELRA